MPLPAKCIGTCTDRAKCIWLYNCIPSAQERKGNAGETLRPNRGKSAICTRTSKPPQPSPHRRGLCPAPHAPHHREGLTEPTPWGRTGARPRCPSSQGPSGPHSRPVARCRPPHNAGVPCPVPAAPRSCRTRTCYCSPRAPVTLRRPPRFPMKNS